MPATSETVDTLRLATAGSVDDGKSTLIGRLLYDAKSILADQLEHIAEVSHARNGNGTLDLALLTDGLRAEREQGITIDVAHRYFATPRRRFILADTPGHEQYTRNMVTGASTAEVAIVLVDARKRRDRADAPPRRGRGAARVAPRRARGQQDGPRRLVGGGLRPHRGRLRLLRLARSGSARSDALPISALHGDNVVESSSRLGWYAGPPLLEHLETVEVPAGEPGELRFPVQWVLRDPSGGGRAYAGRVAGGELRPGAEVVALPAGERARVDGGRDARRPAGGGAGGPVGVGAHRPRPRPRARRPARRGGVRAGPGALAATRTSAGSRRRRLRRRRAAGPEARHRDRARDRRRGRATGSTSRPPSARRRPDGLALNDIGRVRLRVSRPLAVEPYAANRVTGAFVLIDEGTNDTVGAGMIA